MKKFVLIGVVTFVILAVGGAVTYVATMDWNQHKGKIAAQIESITGKKVLFRGNVSLSLLPSPTLSAENVILYNPTGEYRQKPLAEIKKLEAKVSLGALFSDSFDIKRVALKEPKLVFELEKNMRLNWLPEKNANPDMNLRDVNIPLESLTLEKATVQLIDKQKNFDTTLENLNAEVVAQNVYGPYRIEGSYTKGEKPEGFAISLGKIIEDMATSVNMVVNYPSTQSYIRFDGTVFLEKRNVLGSVVFESEKPVDFANEMLGEKRISQAYNLPLAVSAEINTNTAKIDLSNVVVKYGKTSGAGNVLIPLPDAETGIKPKIEFAFNMTDWDLAQAAEFIRSQAELYRGNNKFAPNTKFNLIGDVKALKAYYNGETLRDVAVSFDWVDNQLLLREAKASLLKDTSLGIRGSLVPEKGDPVYKAETAFATGEFDKFMKWLGYEVVPAAPATYQKAAGKATLSGNLRQLQVSPYEVTLDKSVLKGDAGFVFGDKLKAFIIVNTDNINFDNYVAKLSKQEAETVLAKRLFYRLKNTQWLKEADVRLGFKADLAIFENLPLENVDMAIVLNNGVLAIESLKIANAANMSLALQGSLSGLGVEPNIDRLDYSLITNDFMSMCNKLEIRVPNINLQVLKRFEMKGDISGNDKLINLNSNGKLENIDFNYIGSVAFDAPKPLFDGRIELKAPDFVKMMNNFNVKYSPKAFSLGLFALKGNINGDVDNFKLGQAEVNIGSTLFKGDMAWDKTSGRNVFTADAQINRFEVDQFWPEGVDAARISFQESDTKSVEFLKKPYLSKDRINYAFINSFDLIGKFKVDTLLWQKMKFDNLNCAFKLNNGNLNLTEFAADFNGGKVDAKLNLNTVSTPKTDGTIKFTKQTIKGDMLAGSRYGLVGGVADITAEWKAVAASEADFANSLTAKIGFDVEKPLIRGWNLEAIVKDLDQRKNADGLVQNMQSNLQSGSTLFDELKGTLVINQNAYSLNNVVFDAPKFQVVMNASGNLATWDEKAEFEFLWTDSKKNMPGYKFNLNGNLENPALEVNVDAITKMFEEMLQKKIAEQKAREQARLNHLDQLMAAQKTRSVLLKRKINDEIVPLFQNCVSVIDDEQAKQDFEVINDSINKQIKALEDISTLIMTPEFDEAFVDKIAKENDEVESGIDFYIPTIKEVYAKGAARMAERNNAQVLEIQQEVKADYDKSKDEFGQFTPRLNKVGSVLDLGKAATIVNLKTAVDNTLNSANEVAEQALKAYNNIKVSQNGDEILAVVKEQNEKISALKQVQDNMKRTIKALFNEAEKLVVAEEEWFETRQLEEARKKKVEDNISKISVDATGKTTTFIPDIQELEEAEKEVQEENIPVLDFSGKVRRDDAPQKKEEIIIRSGLVTKGGGTKVDTSGTISRD